MRHPAPESVVAARIRTRRIAKRRRQQKMFALALVLVFLMSIVFLVSTIIARHAPSAQPQDTSDSMSTASSSADPDDTPSSQDSSFPESDGGDTQPSQGQESEPESFPESNAPVVLPQPDAPTICIDPGHGFGDPGTGSDYLFPYYEKDVNLAISLVMREMLIAAGYNVVMTRDSDIVPTDWEYGKLLDPNERVDMLSKMEDIDYFLSIHCNSFVGEKRVYGSRLYYYTKNNDETPALADSIASSIQNRFNVKKPSLNALTSSQAFAVTRHEICPAILIEVGFVTDEEEAQNMKNPEWQTVMARSIVNGLLAHIQAQAAQEAKD
jgi:N-acetylmuramoyl-L-alanine amidase